MSHIIVFLLLTGVLATGCNKNEPEPTHINTFSANVNGSSFVPASIELLYGGSSIPGARQVNVQATAGNGHAVTLIMHPYDGTLKTFTTNVGAYSIGSGIYSSSYSTNGEIRISSIDKSSYKDGEVVTGTFQFDTDSTVGTYHIVNGQFSVLIKQ